MLLPSEILGEKQFRTQAVRDEPASPRCVAVSGPDLPRWTPSGAREADLVTTRPGMDVFEAARSARDDLDVRRAVDAFSWPQACDSPHSDTDGVRDVGQGFFQMLVRAYVCHAGQQRASLKSAHAARSTSMLAGLWFNMGPGCGGRGASGLTAAVGCDRLQV